MSWVVMGRTVRIRTGYIIKDGRKSDTEHGLYNVSNNICLQKMPKGIGYGLFTREIVSNLKLKDASTAESEIPSR
jgi:hypothetical protein